METVTIPKIEYRQLKRYSSAYLRVAREIMKSEPVYPYDMKYIKSLATRAIKDYKQGRAIRARSVDQALRKLRAR